jgi:hypothetical protein
MNHDANHLMIISYQEERIPESYLKNTSKKYTLKKYTLKNVEIID